MKIRKSSNRENGVKGQRARKKKKEIWRKERKIKGRSKKIS
jgi:hypothetical protein